MKKGRTFAALAAALALGAAGAARAQEDEESKLLAILAEETAVATKTRVNGDFVPGIVTVLHGDELEALGIETAWEALSLVPGIEAVRDPTGNPNVIVRGLEFPFNSGNVKILIDGVALGRESAGINGIALQIPIQLVDRIEVIRGPGSVIYGDFAFMGLVNIVTRRGGEQAHARYGGDRFLSGGGHASWRSAGGPWEVSVVGGAGRSTDAPVPEPLEGDERRGFGGVHVVRGGLSLTAEAITRRLERSGAQPLAPIGQTHAALEGRFGWDLAPALRSEVRAGYLHDRIDNGNQFTGSVAGGGLDLTWTGLARHTCLFSADVTRGTIDDARFNFPVPPGQPPHVLRLTDVSRDGFGLTLQDTFEISQKLAVTAGVRFDHLSDTGQRATPRFSAVYRMTDRHILKVQYAEGFRAPTFFELYATGVANAALSFEVNKTAELNYVYRNVGTAARATFFYSKLVDMIFVNNSPQGPQFGNFREGRADGFELEWEREVTRAVKASATLSWVDAKDNRNAGPPPSFAFVTQTPPVTVNWLGNIALLVRAAPHTLVGARWNWVGERNTGRDNRGTQLVDLTVTQNDFFLPGAQLRAGVKNLFDDDVRYFDQRPDGGGTYFRWPGRTFFVQLAFSR